MGLQAFLDGNGQVAELGLAGTITQTEVSVLATSTTLVAANTSRKFLILQNISDTSCDVSFDGIEATTTAGLLFYANGDAYVFTPAAGDLLTSAFYAITHDGTTGKKFRVIEGV